MKKFQCSINGYIYNPNNGDSTQRIKPGTAFKDLPEDWICLVCGSSKDKFELYEE